jgi:hypothetical protein
MFGLWPKPIEPEARCYTRRRWWPCANSGLALVIVRARAGQPGTIILQAESDGLKESAIKIESN